MKYRIIKATYELFGYDVQAKAIDGFEWRTIHYTWTIRGAKWWLKMKIEAVRAREERENNPDILYQREVNNDSTRTD